MAGWRGVGGFIYLAEDASCLAVGLVHQTEDGEVPAVELIHEGLQVWQPHGLQSPRSCLLLGRDRATLYTIGQQVPEEILYKHGSWAVFQTV